MNFDKKKIDILFDIAENKHENSEFSSEINSDSDNLNNKKQKKKEIIERNLINRKKTLGLYNRDSIIGYKINPFNPILLYIIYIIQETIIELNICTLHK